MNQKPTPIVLPQWIAIARKQLEIYFKKYWGRALLCLVALYILYAKDVTFDVKMSNAPEVAAAAVSSGDRPTVASTAVAPKAMNVSNMGKPKATEQPAAATPPANVGNLANTYSNLTATNKGEHKSETSRLREEKRRKQLKYVKRFSHVAQQEMKQYGIPASITLAQGLLESNVGESKLATRNNNHFGIKCFSRSCKKGHCSNFTDDSHKDFFRKYRSSWESYRAHSLLLKRNSRYSKLFELRRDDYRGWAHGLKKAGYATDKRYAEKIINLIEDLNLDQYDD